MNKSVVGLPKLLYWNFIAQLEVGSERYEFSKVDHQSVIWRKKEITTFGFVIRSFYLIMGIAKQLPSLVSSTILIVHGSFHRLGKPS